MICKFCQKEFFRKDHPKRGKFCSVNCHNNSRKGKKLPLRSEEWRKNLSKALTGKKATPETRKKQSLAKIGNKQSSETVEKRVSQIRGEKSSQWKGGYENRLLLNKQRRVRKLKAEGSHTLNQWQELKARYGFMCLCCKKVEPLITLSEDHIIPLTKGGNDYIENIQPLCRSCNSKKYTKTIRY